MSRLFVVSDIHGHYTPLKQALDRAGFNENDPNHIFLCCGDLFDRGQENRAVLEFVSRLPRKILIRGNHEDRLAELLRSRRLRPTDERNGVLVTMEEFFGPGCVENGFLRLPEDRTMAERLQTLVDSMADHFETAHYVFVHGWLPLEETENGVKIMENWRNADAKSWQEARTIGWPQMYGSPLILPDKTIVCGHWPTWEAARFDRSRGESDADIFYGKGMIAIDAGTATSGRVNVLVLDGEAP